MYNFLEDNKEEHKHKHSAENTSTAQTTVTPPTPMVDTTKQLTVKDCQEAILQLKAGNSALMIEYIEQNQLVILPTRFLQLAQSKQRAIDEMAQQFLILLCVIRPLQKLKGGLEKYKTSGVFDYSQLLADFSPAIEEVLLRAKELKFSDIIKLFTTKEDAQEEITTEKVLQKMDDFKIPEIVKEVYTEYANSNIGEELKQFNYHIIIEIFKKHAPALVEQVEREIQLLK